MSTVSLTYSHEEILVTGLESGNRQTFDKLYKAYAPALLGYIEKIVGNRTSAEKVLQRAFVEIWEKRHEYDASRGRLFTWLLKQAKKTATQYLELKQKKRKNENQTAIPSVNICDTSAEDEQEVEKNVFDLLYYNKHTIKEVSEMMGIKEDKLKCLLRHAIKNLKTLPK